MEQKLQHALHALYGFETFRGRQEGAVLSIASGRDTMVLMPTGAGKSLCFALPAAVLPGTAIVIMPLLALIQDQCASLNSKGIRTSVLNSTITSAERSELLQSLKSDTNAPKILLTTPESVDTASVQSALTTLYNEKRLSFFAIDECHCISSWGHDFRPAYLKLGKLRSQYPATPIIALTATATQQVRDDVVKSLKLRKDTNVFTTSFDRPNIEYQVEYVDLMSDEEEPMMKVVQHIKQASTAAQQANKASTSTSGGSNSCCCIVYAHKRTTVNELAAFIQKKAGVRCEAYHAGRKDADRVRIQQQWTSGEVPVVCATVAFGMGIDKADVRLVVHYDMPKSLEGLYQESGRAGRDGLPSRSVVMYSMDHQSLLEFLTKKESRRKAAKRKRNKQDDSAQVPALQQLHGVVQYCMLTECRRLQLLQHFGENPLGGWKCAGCDACIDSERVTQQVAQLGLLKLKKRDNGFASGRNWGKGGDTGAWDGAYGSEDDGDQEGSDVDSEDDVSEGTAAAREAAGAAASLNGKSPKGNANKLLRMMEAAESKHAKGHHSNKANALSALLDGKAGGKSSHAAASAAASDPGIAASLREKAVARLQDALAGVCKGQVSSGVVSAMAQALEADCFRGVSGAAGYKSKVVNMTTTVKRATSTAQLPRPALELLQGSSDVQDNDAEVAAREGQFQEKAAMEGAAKVPHDFEDISGAHGGDVRVLWQQLQVQLDALRRLEESGGKLEDVSEGSRVEQSCLQLLEQLQRAHVTVESIKRDQLGKQVKTLGKTGPCLSVREAAKQVVQTWRQAITS